MHRPFWAHLTLLETDVSSVLRAREFVRSRLVEQGLTTLAVEVALVANEMARFVITDSREAWFSVRLVGGGGEVLLVVRGGAYAGATGALPNGRTSDGDRHHVLGITQVLSERWGVDLTRADGDLVWASFPAGTPAYEPDGLAPSS